MKHRIVSALLCVPSSLNCPAGIIDDARHLRKIPARPCIFVLTKGMSAVGPRPTADIQLLVFARHPHRCSDRLGVPKRARLYSASIQSSSLSSSVSTSWEISCGGDGSVSGRGASLSIGAIGISWTKCVVAGFAACSLPSDIGGNRSRHSGGRKLAIIRLKPFKRH